MVGFFSVTNFSPKNFRSEMLAYENLNPKYHYKQQVLQGYKEYLKLEN